MLGDMPQEISAWAQVDLSGVTHFRETEVCSLTLRRWSGGTPPGTRTRNLQIKSLML